jgi:hypothetical protein
MSNFEYTFRYLLRSWYRTWLTNFRSWKLLMFGPSLDNDYYYYLWFATVINSDLTPSKHTIKRVRKLMAEFPIS